MPGKLEPGGCSPAKHDCEDRTDGTEPESLGIEPEKNRDDEPARVDGVGEEQRADDPLHLQSNNHGENADDQYGCP